MRVLLLVLALVLTGPGFAQDRLPGDLEALLHAAIASDNPDDFSDAVRVLSLTQPGDAIAFSAGGVSAEAEQGVRQQLGLAPIDMGAVEPVESAPVAPVSVVEAETVGETEHTGDLTLRQRPAQWARTLAHGQLDLWTGRAELGLQFDDGNSERQDYHFGIDVERDLSQWGFRGQLNYAYSEADGAIGRDEINGEVRGEREAGDRWTVFAKAEFEQDALSSNDYTAFLSGGVGYRVLDNDRRSWVLRASPGARFTQPVGQDVEVNAAAELSSEFHAHLTESVQFRSDTSVIVTDAGRAEQEFALTNALGELWALELSYRYKYEFEVEPGFEQGDSQTKISIIRSF